MTNKKTKFLFNFDKQSKIGLAFILPALVYMIIMVGYPIVYNWVLSFQDVSAFNMAQGARRPFIGLGNYRTIFSNDVLPIALKNTFIYTIVSLFFQFVFGMLLALLLNKKFFLSKTLRGLLVISWVMPTTVVALLFKYMLSPDAGIVDSFLTMIGIIKEPVGWLLKEKTAIWGPIFANIWTGIPFNMLILSTGLSGISEEVYESAGIDGANALQRFFKITLPLLRPAIMSVLILGFVYTFKVFEHIFVMTAGGPVNATEVMATFSYKLSFRNYYFGQGAAVANVLFLILFCVALIYLRLIRKEESM